MGAMPVDWSVKVTVFTAQLLPGWVKLKFATGLGLTTTGTVKLSGLPLTTPLNTAEKVVGVNAENPPLWELEGGNDPNVHEIFVAPAGAVNVMLAGAQAFTDVVPNVIWDLSSLSRTVQQIKKMKLWRVM
jgi:hypothetical protein